MLFSRPTTVGWVTKIPDSNESGGDRCCIFWESGGPLTREHAIAGWITDLLNALEPCGPTPEWALQYAAGRLVERDRQHRAADPTVVVRTVCEECNSGWLSDLERRVRPVMEPMIRGRGVTLSLEHQIDVATWVSKTVAALEFHEPATAVTRPQDRRLIREELRSPHHHLVRLA